MNFMDQIVISSKFYAQGCNEEFSFHTKQNLLFQHKFQDTLNSQATNIIHLKQSHETL